MLVSGNILPPTWQEIAAYRAATLTSRASIADSEPGFFELEQVWGSRLSDSNPLVRPRGGTATGDDYG